MMRIRGAARRIVLFVEGDSERSDARRSTLPDFFHRWLDPQLPQQGRVGITAQKFHGVSNYLGDLAQKIEIFLTERGANFVIGLWICTGCRPDALTFQTARAYKKRLRGPEL